VLEASVVAGVLRYRLALTDPADPVWQESWLCDGRRRWHITRTMADVPPDRSEAPAGGAEDVELRRLAALLRGDLAALGGDFTVVTTATADGATATLTAKAADAPVTRISVTFDAALRPTAVATDDRQGVRSNHRIVRLEDGVVLADDRFRPAEPGR
jgi:hypothetical protein